MIAVARVAERRELLELELHWSFLSAHDVPAARPACLDTHVATITRYCTQHVALHVYSDLVIAVVELVVLRTVAAADQAWD